MFSYMFQVKMSDRFLETAERYLNRQNLWEPANDFAAAVGAFMVKDRARGRAVLEEMVHLARQKLDAARDTRGRRRFRHYLGDLANALDMFQIFSRSWIDRHVSSLRPEATPRPEAAEYDPQRGSRDIREGVQRQTIIHHQGGQQEVVIPQEVEDQLLATPSKTDEAAMDLGESTGIFLGTPSPPKTLHLPSERSLDVKEPVADSERSLELAPCNRLRFRLHRRLQQLALTSRHNPDASISQRGRTVRGPPVLLSTLKSSNGSTVRGPPVLPEQWNHQGNTVRGPPVNPWHRRRPEP